MKINLWLIEHEVFFNNDLFKHLAQPQHKIIQKQLNKDLVSK